MPGDDETRAKNAAKRRRQYSARSDHYREYMRKWFRKNSYGLSEEAYSALVKKHDGHCAGCNSKAKLCIDHNHATGKIRGLLCHHCNTALGLTKDSPETLISLANYLVRNQ